MRIGYYKSILFRSFKNSIRNFKLRKYNKIGIHCIIHKDTSLGNNIRIGSHVSIAEGVTLSRNVIVGAQAKLSRIFVGENTHIEYGVICTGFGNGRIHVGRESYLGIYNVLDWSENIKIGDYVHIAGPSTGIWTHSSADMCLNGVRLGDKSEKNRPKAPVNIEDNVYIGGNCTIYPGVTIGHHSIVAPNSAVDKDIAPYSLVGGVPARLIKKIDPSKRKN